MISEAKRLGFLIRFPIFLILTLTLIFWGALYFNILSEWVLGPNIQLVAKKVTPSLNVERSVILIATIKFYLGIESARFLFNGMPTEHRQVFWAGLTAKNFEFIISAYWFVILTAMVFAPLSTLLDFPAIFDLYAAGLNLLTFAVLYTFLLATRTKLNVGFLKGLILPLLFTTLPGFNFLDKTGLLVGITRYFN